MTAQKPSDHVEEVTLTKALSERYLSYALSTIMSRSLPDVRDGLKPVHRRLLFAMRMLKLDPKSGFKKCARVVGDVIGKYHPHGDQAVYDAMVRLAQDFAQRYTLVEGQGNFGNIDGDNAAAMRYTEARLTEVATALLQDIDQDTVNFRPTYDGEEAEPTVLPAAFPNLLANGSAGIAVGMATSIPPHNAGELCDALLHLIKHPNASIEKLVDFVPGPDFPTGGIIVEPRDSIIESYSTGRGGFRLRAKWEVEKGKAGTYVIVVTEIPYQVQKSKLVEKIADLINAKKVPMLADVRDESAEDVRLVLEPRTRAVDPEILMEGLFKVTDLETRFSLNMNVLDANQTPRVMNLREVLQAFLDHRQDVLIRRSKYRLGKIEHRLEILAGYLIAYLNLDEVIRIIREEDDAKAELMRTFELSDVQAEAILNMRLRSLRKLEEMEIRKEHAELEAERDELQELLADEGLRWRTIAAEIRDIRSKFGSSSEIGVRLSDFADAPSVEIVPLEAMIEREPITVVCSEKGWIRAMKGHMATDAEIRYRDGDSEGFRLHAMTTDKLLVFTTDGRFYTLGCDKLPGGRGSGEPIRLMADIAEDQEIHTIVKHVPGRQLLLASNVGRGFMVDEDGVIAQTRGGKQVLNLGNKEKAMICEPIQGDHVAVIGQNRKMLVFPVAEVPTMTRGRGVILQKYKDGLMADLMTFNLADGISWQMGSRNRQQTDLLPWQGKRANAGRLAPTGFPRTNKFDRTRRPVVQEQPAEEPAAEDVAEAVETPDSSSSEE